MRKYTSKSQKVDMYSEKYGLSAEEVNRILSEHEDVLTFEELKIKYDNPNIGVLPEWLTEESLDLMIWKTIHDYWSPIFEQKLTKQELYNEHQEYIRKKIGLFENHNHIKSALIKRMITLAQEYARKGKYFLGSTDEVLYTDNTYGVPRYRFELPVTDHNTVEDDLFLERIRSIKDKSVKHLLIITGYLICDIEGLRKDYIELLRNLDDEDIKNNVKNLEAVIIHNDEIEMNRYAGITSKERKHNLSIKDVIEALKMNILDNNKKESTNKTLSEVKYYLQAMGIA